MEIKIDFIQIDQFKGIKNRYIELKGKSAVIFGKNGTGKTTIADAFTWVLTGQDSACRSKFSVIEIESSGEVVNNQDCCVKLGLIIDGDGITIERNYKQKWTKKRGDKNKKLTGHTTTFLWDSVPVSKAVFEGKIKVIGGVDRFKYLTDPTFFCSRICAKKRRKLLIDMIPGISVKKPGFVGNRTIEDSKKIIMADRKKVNEKLLSLPERIDELKKMMGDYTGDINLLESERETVIKGLNKNRAEKRRLEHGTLNKEKADKLKILNLKITALDNEIREEKRADQERIERDIHKNKKDLRILERDLESAIYEKDNIFKTIRILKQKKESLKNKWVSEKNKCFTPNDKCRCCGQSIPEELIGEQEKSFGDDKAHEIKRINEMGMAIAEELKGAVETHDKAVNIIEDYNNKSDVIKNIIDGLKISYKSVEKKTEKRAEQELKPLFDEKYSLEKNLYDSEDGKLEKMSTIGIEIEKLSNRETVLSQKINQIKNNSKIKDQIEKREVELKGFAIHSDKLENQLIQLEDYAVEISRAVEKSVNEKFNLVKWRLFENQLNGGINEICEPMVNGVLFGQDLNTGSRINAGIDAINTLSNHFNCTMPIIIDNAESITAWEKTDKQVIRLVAGSDFDDITVKTF